ncbi:hypothetical protein ACFWJM_16750 [Streptomyces sp. NPDC127077]|uniref:hypothetical protein n=1 Tax=Streptomyces sp. NPDC127077 TaxID=3347131 RepID=UPI003662B47E
MLKDEVELQHHIEVLLHLLGSRNQHHEFEAICLEVARKRFASNLIPATGPVSSGGDQGRDAETHWTEITASSGQATSVFDTLVSNEPTVMACTIQRSRVVEKIRKDLASICSRGRPVSRVIYFTLEPVAVSRRHRLCEEAEQIYGVHLEIMDGRALAVNLADKDLRHVARGYLHVSRSAMWFYAWARRLGFITVPALLTVVLCSAVVSGSSYQRAPVPVQNVPLLLDSSRTVNPPNSQGSNGSFLTDLQWTSMMMPGTRRFDAKLVFVPESLQYVRARLVADLRLGEPCVSVAWTVSTDETQRRSGKLTPHHARDHIDMPLLGRTPTAVTITFTGSDGCNPIGLTLSSPHIVVCEPGDVTRNCKINPLAPPVISP